MKNMIEFFRLVGKLKEINRSGWVRHSVKNPESVADHSWRTAAMALILADKMEFDVSRAVKIALVHDIGEAIIGDLMPHELSTDHKFEKEKQAVQEITSKLDKELGKEISNLWLEFEKGSSKEGRLVRDVDKLEMAIQALDYESAQKKDLSEFFGHCKEHIKDPYLKSLLLEIIRMRS